MLSADMTTNLEDLPQLAVRPKATASDELVRFEKENGPVLDSVRALGVNLFRQPIAYLSLGQAAPGIDESRNLRIPPEPERQAKVIASPAPKS
jgi:hypothetical protein